MKKSGRYDPVNKKCIVRNGNGTSQVYDVIVIQRKVNVKTGSGGWLDDETEMTKTTFRLVDSDGNKIGRISSFGGGKGVTVTLY